jgi:hypothetical protein
MPGLVVHCAVFMSRNEKTYVSSPQTRYLNKAYPLSMKGNAPTVLHYYKTFNLETERHGRMVDTRASYSGGPEFKSRPRLSAVLIEYFRGLPQSMFCYVLLVARIGIVPIACWILDYLVFKESWVRSQLLPLVKKINPWTRVDQYHSYSVIHSNMWIVPLKCGVKHTALWSRS